MRTLRIMRTLAVTIVLLAGALLAPLAATASILGPTSYLSFDVGPDNSPFSVGTPTTFYLEDFEDGDLDTLGASMSADNADLDVTPSGQNFVDSVDDDNGLIDGNGNSGRSLGISPIRNDGANTVTFTFDALALGQLPTHAGIVFTDIGRSTTGNGTGEVSKFEAFNSLGISLGFIGPFNVGDGAKNGGTAEDLFFGVTDPGGIWKIAITMNSNDAELDHLQYGFTRQITADAPEPASVLVWACLGLAAFAGVRARWLC